jgi:hypothetical protein
MAEAFLSASDAPDQIAQVLRVLILSAEFEAPPAKLRRPFEYLAALYRGTGAEVTAHDNGFQWHLARAGWHQHAYVQPTGHPDRIEAWTGASTLNRYIDIALGALEEGFDGATADLSPLADPDETFGDFASRLAETLSPGQGEAIAGLLAEVYGLDTVAASNAISVEDRQALARAAVALAALTPEFLLR